MDQVIEFFKKLFDSSDWPPRWHCGQWTEFHGWLYIISDLLIWSAYFTIPIVIIRYISKKQNIRFTRLYFLFAAFILACGATHFLDAIAFWIPAYRLSALVRFITGALSWITVFYLVKLLPVAFSLKSQKELEVEVEQRKKAEAQVRESEEQVQTIFDAAPDAVIVIDESGDIVKWNPRAETLFGWKENEVTGKLLSETIIPGRFREMQTKVLKHFLRTGEGPLLGKIVETSAVTKDNVELDIALNIAATKKNQGRYLFIGFVRDITEQRKAELQIQKQKQDIQDFIDSMSTLSVKLDTDGKIQMVNKIALQASGLSMEELLGTNFTEGKWWTYDPEVHSRVRDAFKKASLGITINYDENIFVFDQVLTIDFSLIPILKPDGSVDYIVGEGRDITAQKKAEEKIRQMNAELENRVEEKTSEIIQSEKKFRNLIENTTDIISLTDKNFKTIYRSPSAERITGFTNEEREKLSETELFHPDDLPGVQMAMKEISKVPHKQFNLTYRHRHKDGHYVWLEGMMTNMLHDKTIRAVLFNLRDVTEAKKAEELIVQSEIKYRSLFENNPMPIWVIDSSSFKFLDVNEAAIRHYGYSREEFLSMTALDIRPESEKERLLHQNLPADSNSYQPRLWKHLKKDNSTIYVEVIGHNITFDGKPARLVLSNDVTKRIKMEEMLKESYKEISDYKYALDESSIVAITDQKGVIKYVNNNFCKISKYNREELIGQDHRIINSGHHPKEFIRDLWMTIANGKIWKGELKNRAKDGTIYWVDTTIIPFLNQEGKPYQYVAIRADITERKQAEQAFYESQQLLMAIVDNSTAVIYVKDLQGRYLLVNRRFSELFHIKQEEVVGKTDYDFFSKEEADAFRQMDKRTAVSGHALTEEEKVPHDDGLHTYLSVKSTLRDEQNRPHAIFGISTDMTGVKEAEENLRKSEREISDYKFALDESSIVAITDQKGIIKHANENFCKISKYSREELIGQDHRIINSGYHSKEFIRDLWVTIAHGKIWKGELKNKAKDGSIYWVDTTIVPFLDEKGKPYQYVAIRADITERKQVEENLQKSLKEIKEYQYALDESSIVAITDQKGIIRHANDNFCEISKYSREELIGQDHRVINSGYHSKEFIRDLWVTIANGKIWKGELKNKAKDGSIYWVDTTIIPFLDEKGKPYQYVAIRADITERKRSEETIVKTLDEKKIILESIGDAFFAVDKTWTVTYWNRIAEIALGVGKQEIIGKNLWEIFSDSLDSKSYRKYHEAIETNQVVHFEDYHPALDKWYEISAYPSENGLSVYFKDITERQKAEREIKRLNAELEVKVIERTEELQAANREMEAFTYSVSHDLRAPLRGIVGFASILEEDYASQLDDEARRITSVIRNNTLRMARLIDDLLAFSRTGKQELSKKEINTKSMVTEIVEDLSGQNKGGKIISWDIQALPDMNGDLNTIRQVWINLISNAIKYSGTRDHPRIEIGSKKEGGQVMFYVKDNGVGFDENYKHKLFKVFQRLHRADEFEGTGVGLALVEKIVSRHGGKVWAEGKEDEGACFYFSLPV